MRNMTISVDGETLFSSDVPETVLPEEGELLALLPDILRPQPGQKPSALTRITVLTMLVDMMRQGLESSPLLQPITVTVQPHGIGKATITVDMAMPDGDG